MNNRHNTTIPVLLTLSLVVALSVAVSLCLGPYPIHPAMVWSVLSNGPDDTAVSAAARTMHIVVWDIRLSRTLLALFIGAGLSVAGVVFQGILRNPLADPFTLGVSSGGAFGASLAISFGLPAILPGLAGMATLPLAALFGSLLALGAVLWLGHARGAFGRESLVLGGIVVATFLSACISLFKALNEESVAAIVFWIMGSLQGRGWEHLNLYLPFFVTGIVIIACYSRELDLLCLGSDQARNLGVDTKRARLLLLLGASLVTAAAVAVSGVIGFVGLVVPHLLRLLLGSDNRPLLASSAVLGAILLLWSDLAARNVLQNGAELPVGVVTALIGAPFFCLILLSRRAT